MKEHDATEIAFKNGYKKAVEEIFEGFEEILVRPEAPTALFYHCSKHSYAELKKKYTEDRRDG